MKKFFQISFLAVYIFSVVGVHISSHFCGDYLVSVDVNIILPSEPTNCCESEEESECCQNEDVKIQIEDAQKESKFISLDKNVINQKEIDYPDLSTSEKTFFNTLAVNAIKIPPLDISIKNCSWLI